MKTRPALRTALLGPALLGPALLGALLATPAPSHAAELELIPMLGIADLENEDNDADYDAGLAVGVSFGGRLASIFSLHGQLHIHPLSTDNDDVSGTLLLIQLAGLFHLVDNKTLDFMLGPTLGGFSYAATAEAPGDDVTFSFTGPSVALQAGLYFKISPTMALGPTFQYGQMYPSEACVQVGSRESCDEIDEDADPITLILLNAGLKIIF